MIGHFHPRLSLVSSKKSLRVSEEVLCIPGMRGGEGVVPTMCLQFKLLHRTNSLSRKLSLADVMRWFPAIVSSRDYPAHYSVPEQCGRRLTAKVWCPLSLLKYLTPQATHFLFTHSLALYLGFFFLQMQNTVTHDFCRCLKSCFAYSLFSV